VPSLSQSFRRPLAVTVLFVALTGIMTWPQPLVLATHGPEHQDVFFNLWRLRWVQHALASSTEKLFNANQFHPERRVLAYSDAMLVEGVVAAPALALGVRPMLVHNLLLLGAIAASAVGMFFLARHISGSDGGGVIAGIVFAFASYRFEHYMHMELQWVMWAPWAFWALQRTIETGSARYGLATGLFIALQMLSSIYYGIFLGMLLAIVAVLQLIALPRRSAWVNLRALAVGAVVAAAVSSLYAMPYSSASTRVGVRGENEVRMFSAKPRNYLSATESNLLYGQRHRGAPERRLFPGVLPLILALVGLLLIAPSPAVIAYAIGLAAAFELSLGMNGRVYPLLYDHSALFQGLRAPARASIFCLLFLGVLAARGYAALAAAVPGSARRAMAVCLPALLLFEYWVAPLRLVPYHNEAPPLYAWLAQQPSGIVAEFPMPGPYRLPGEEARYAYMSTFHWMRLVNGYSGYYPPSYLVRTERVAHFPDARSLQQLRLDRVRYVIVHAAGYDPAAYAQVLDEALNAAGLAPLGKFDDGWQTAWAFELR
jgi:hypothetical protein